MGEKGSAKLLKDDEQNKTKRPKRIVRKAERLKEENEIIYNYSFRNYKST